MREELFETALQFRDFDDFHALDESSSRLIRSQPNDPLIGVQKIVLKREGIVADVFRANWPWSSMIFCCESIARSVERVIGSEVAGEQVEVRSPS